jgi:hypothetical protein
MRFRSRASPEHWTNARRGTYYEQMQKMCLLVLAAVTAAPLIAQPARPTLEADAALRNSLAAAYASGACSATPLACDVAARGTLGKASCTIAVDGTPVDFYTFDASPGTLFSIDVHANGAQYTTPRLALLPPIGDGEKPPIMIGSTSLTIRWTAVRASRFAIAVGSADRDAKGDYIIGTRCRHLVSYDVPPQCTQQMLQCGQTTSAVLSPDSCDFDHVASTGYLVMARPNEPVRAEIDANFPFSTRYRYRYSGLTQSSASGATGHAIVSGVSAENLELWIESVQRGFFSASLTCSSPACARPIITKDITDQTVAPGGRALLSLEADATQPVTIDWMEADGTSWGRSATFLTPTIQNDRVFFAVVSNACGATQSRAVMVHVDRNATQRRRVGR